MRLHRSSQLILVASVGLLNALASLGCLYVYDLAPRAIATLGTLVVVPLWFLWLSSLWNWFRGAQPLPQLASSGE